METKDACHQEKQADEPRQCGDDQQNDNKDVQQPCQDAEQLQQSFKNVEDSKKCDGDAKKVSDSDCSGEKRQEANGNKDIQEPCQDAEQHQQSSKNVEESKKCDGKVKKVSGSNFSEEKRQEAKRAGAPSSNDQQTPCATESTQCKEKCLNKKPPSKRPQRCPDHSVDSFHPDMRVQNYLYLENNRLYCHNIFNKAGRRVWDVERKNPKYSCFWPISSECYRRRAASLAVAAHKQWVENHQKRNEAYTANVLCVFHTNNWNAYQPGKNFAIKLIPIRKRC